jgi:undecaprenyl-diphosphatase
LNSLIEFDHWLFERINLDWTNGFFDWLMPNITDLHKQPAFIMAMVPLLLFWVWKKRELAAAWILVLVLSVGLSDMISYRVIKAQVERARPIEAGMKVELRTSHHSGTSFPSNHSSNMFAAATVLSAAFPVAWPAFFTFAILVAYSRVYVGVHFPIDVIAGALLGMSVAWTVRKLFAGWLPKARPKKQSRRARLTDDFGLADNVIKNDGDSSRGQS